jgi:hypothetical protein
MSFPTPPSRSIRPWGCRRPGLALAVAGLCALACEPEPRVEAPGWFEDVQPILMANCAHCHGAPAAAGAPATFRLDVYDDLVDHDGRGNSVVVLGAGHTPADRALAPGEDLPARILARVRDEARPMPPPPAAPLTDLQRKILERWWSDGVKAGGPPRRGARPNRRPRLLLAEPVPARLTGGTLRISYEIRDPDGDPVIGEIVVGASPPRLATIRHLGPAVAEIDVSAMAPGPHPLFARAHDGQVAVEWSLGAVTIER